MFPAFEGDYTVLSSNLPHDSCLLRRLRVLPRKNPPAKTNSRQAPISTLWETAGTGAGDMAHGTSICIPLHQLARDPYADMACAPSGVSARVCHRVHRVWINSSSYIEFNSAVRISASIP